MKPLVMATPIDWEAYSLTDDDLARIIAPAQLVEKAEAILHGKGGVEGVAIPIPKVGDRVRLRRGKFHVWGGINHHGKTAMLKQCALQLAREGEVVCVASLEELPEETFADLAQQAVGMWVNEPGKVREVADCLQGKLWLYDQQGMMSPDRLCALMAYAVKVYGCTHFVIDSLMRLGVNSEDNEEQRVFSNRMTHYAKALNLGVHLVCHVRKQQDETSIPSMMGIRGSGSITDQADAVFILWRNKSEEREAHEPQAVLVVEKQRGRPNWIGKVRLWHEPTSGQFIEEPNADPQWFLPVRRFS
jgi:twinkle protein